MANKRGKFVGAYIPKDLKRKLDTVAAQLDRPLAWVIEKILVEGVKHPTTKETAGNKAAAKS